MFDDPHSHATLSLFHASATMYADAGFYTMGFHNFYDNGSGFYDNGGFYHNGGTNASLMLADQTMGQCPGDWMGHTNLTDLNFNGSATLRATMSPARLSLSCEEHCENRCH